MILRSTGAARGAAMRGARPHARDPDYTAPRPAPVISPVAM